MQYQIVCHSPKGYAGAFADEFLRFLPEDTLQTETDTAPVAPVQIICFETGGMRPDTIPPEVSRYLNQLNDHVIFLLSVVPFVVDDLLERELLKLVVPLLPRVCDFRGLGVSPCHPSEVLLLKLRQRCSEAPYNACTQKWLDQCEQAVGHPDRADLDAGSRFAQHVLGVTPAVSEVS